MLCSGQLWEPYLIFFIHNHTEDIYTVSFVDAGSPGKREDIMHLCGVAVFRQGFLLEKLTDCQWQNITILFPAVYCQTISTNSLDHQK